MDTNKSRNKANKSLKIWMTAIRNEWQETPSGCDNFCRLIEKKYGGDYNYFCGLSRKFFGNPIKRNGEWLWKG